MTEKSSSGTYLECEIVLGEVQTTDAHGQRKTEEQPFFTLPPENNPALWKAMKNLPDGELRRVNHPDIEILPVEHLQGKTSAFADVYLQEALRDIPYVLISRDRMTMILRDAPADHPSVAALMKSETQTTRDTDVVAKKTGDTGKITKESQADAQKRYEAAKAGAKGEQPKDSRAAANDQLKRLFNKR